MREYHRKSCRVSPGVYKQVKGILQDYDRLKRDRLDILYGSRQTDDMPRGSDVGMPTEQRAIRLSYIDNRLVAIDQSAVLMRVWLGEKVTESFDPVKAYWSYDYYNCQHKRTRAGDNGPSRRTWHRCKDRFTECIAEKLKLF